LTNRRSPEPVGNSNGKLGKDDMQYPPDYLAHRQHHANGLAYSGNGCDYCDLAYADRVPDYMNSDWRIGSDDDEAE
jgi:hypothetical protein